ncbi:hypothetical protein NB311A_01654 [Nitrobacter sp. Nb-311A]|uniref:hypothetical protein n=1 Tax=unclassified Nitrobacter TaxID=2620411 RepID=UPI0000688012|nr:MULTISPECIES: hypothetical protein [unclassified Nitrobacter]EAQ36169.1 hypothetical protein NB311A_01654 [Nitrobacter sp. Nb-311A]MCB1391621.1 hypothetical protein [Nitrobacter sp.]MCV0386917.1 hypothetical protein [Nitrobacter sp.]
MTGFVDRIVARGAGLPLLERAATLRLRPVSSFEAGDAGPLLAGEAAPVIDDSPRIFSNPAFSHLRRPEQYEPAARRSTIADSSPPAFDAPEPAEKKTTPPWRVQTEGRTDSFDVSANLHRAPRKQAFAAERNSDAAGEISSPVRSADEISSPVRSVGDNLKIQAPPITTERVFVEAIASPPRHNIPNATPSSADATPEASTPGWREPPSLGAREDSSFAMAETHAPVTVTVGRIDVQFLPPPAPPAALPSPPRSSGFGAYARARRGIPR